MSTFSKHPSRFPAGYPVIEKGNGCHVWSGDKKYVDWGGGLGGTGVLGHAPPAVVKAVQDAVASGTAFHTETREERETSDLLCSTLQNVGCQFAERVRWCLNGTDATHTAVRLARAITGRTRIGVFHGAYHGDSTGDVFLSSKQPARGIDRNITRPAMLTWNDSNTFRFANLAAVIFEIPLEDPTPEFVDAMQSFCKSTGTLLIADEVVTGFRVGLGGACRRYRINPDLACYGKALGSGVPVAALVGKQDLMREFDLTHTDSPVWASWTHAGNRIGLAACQATLQTLDAPAFDRLKKVGSTFRFLFEAHFRAEVRGQNERSVCVFKPKGGYTEDEIRAMFWQVAAEAGHLFYATNFPSLAHDVSVAALENDFSVIASDLDARISQGQPFHAPSPLFARQNAISV